MKSKFPRPFTTTPQLTRVVITAIALTLVANFAGAATYTYSDSGGNHTGAAMESTPTAAFDTVEWNITSGYFGTTAYSNKNLVFTNVALNQGYSVGITTFESATTVTGTGPFSLSLAIAHDFVFAGNMTGYTGAISIASTGGTNTTLGAGDSSIVQFGGTIAGGTVALGTVTGSGSNRVINNVAGTGAITANVLKFNYGTGASYDSVKITNAITQRQGIHFIGSATIEASGVIGGAGALHKSGSGTLTLSGSNNYTGATNVDGGTLAISGTTSGTSSINMYTGGSLVVKTGGTLTTAGTLETFNTAGANITVETGATLNAGSGNISWNPGTFKVDGALNFTNGFVVSTDETTTISGNGTITAASFSTGNTKTVVNFTNSGSMTLVGSLTLAAKTGTGSGSFTAAFNQSAGTINAAGLSLNASTSTYTLTGGRINLGSGGIGGTGGTKKINLGAGTLGAYANWSSSAAMALTDTTTGTTFNTLDSANNITGHTITLSGVLSGVGGKLNKDGAGTLTLSAANTYSGLTTVSDGTLAYGINNAIGTGGITVNSAAATLALGAYTDSVGTVTVAGGGQITGSGTLTSTGSFEMKDGSVSAKLAGTGIALNKTTAGTVTLSAVNTYTGTTTISGGKLTIAATGAINSSSAITIQGGELNYDSTTALNKATTFSGTGGTLSGTGTITPAVSVTSGNTYTAGALGGVGTQTLTGGVKFESGSIFSWDIMAAASDTGAGALNAGSYDQVIGTATGSAAILNIVSSNGFSSAFWDSDKSWNNLFTTGFLSGIFSSITGSGIVWSGGQGSVANQGYFTTSGSNLNWTAVPEPTSALAGLLLGAGLLRRRRGVA